MQTKTTIRKEITKQRNELLDEEVIQKSKQICKRITSSALYHEADVILVYSAIGHEVKLDDFVQDAWMTGKQVYFPKVIGQEMEFFRVSSYEQLKEGYFHILEPKETNTDQLNLQRLSNKCMMILPGLAFDHEGYRIGYGKGFYDRFLHKYNLNHQITTIGVGFQFQLISSFEHDSFDYPIAYFYSENEEVALHDSTGIM